MTSGDDRVEVDVWTSGDGEVQAIGVPLAGDRRATPVAGEGQSISKAVVSRAVLEAGRESGRGFRLNRESGELEPYD
jgi:hypothetical protein